MERSRYQYSDVAERVRWHRAHLGVTQEEYADAIGAGRTQVKNWENGSSRPAVEYALKMKERYGLTLDWLYAGEDRDLPSRVFEAWRSRSTT